MSIEMKDLRTKITTRTDVVLEALSRAELRDRSEIAREALDEWAARRLHAASLMQDLAAREGLAGALQGKPGQARDSQGK